MQVWFHIVRVWVKPVLLTAALMLTAPIHAEAPAPLALTENGLIRGAWSGGMRAFRGIPYAAPPLTSLRWKPPRLPDNWRGTRGAEAFAPSCAQNFSSSFAAPSTTEDCLYLNVFAESVDVIGKARRPVMVWIHGGALRVGSSDDYDASRLVLDGHTVVVTINYRLGLFGWFAHPSLRNEGLPFGNYGLMDQQFAIRWVQRNIAAFGGDPTNITIFGESGGGAAVIANLASPTAKGLFQRAIIQSGGYVLPTYPSTNRVQSLKQAEENGRRFAVAAGCSDQSAACLRAIPTTEILRLANAYQKGLIIDGSTIIEPLSSAFTSGRFNHVPVINGTTRDEGRFFIANREIQKGASLRPNEYSAALSSYFGKFAERVRAEYPLTNYSSPSLALSAAYTDSFMACTARELNRWIAPQTPTYAYEFNDQNAPNYYANVSFPMGAAHSFELPYIFPGFHGASGMVHVLNRTQEALSRRMVQLWTDFTHQKAGTTITFENSWPRYNRKWDNFLPLDNSVGAPSREFTQTHKCAFWKRIVDY